ncbi:MAG: hypothetical protein EOO06_10385 [Chitinophagaceae bacterium]|nr:MAG: hypothetical protein EOO06_10385 [Chitinophagaceae bacterium]
MVLQNKEKDKGMLRLLFLFLASLYAIHSNCQKNLASDVRRFIPETTYYQYADKKGKRTFSTGNIDSYPFNVVITSAFLDSTKSILSIEGYALQTKELADTISLGVVGVEILVAQKKKRGQLKDVRYLGFTNDSLVSPMGKDGFFKVDFRLKKRDALIFFAGGTMIEYMVGELID